MPNYIINKLILTAGAWNNTGCKDKHLERQFNSLLNELRITTGTTPEGAVKMLMAELGEVEAMTA
ncbi:hypothetical protein [Sporosarcina psychrophila]|uniref:hypothetical protein n=1 Tax=Sporosarcina psychrophila TaxID=1476 RepID=UPI00078E838A|nr:hypothetical protein [Sporosarcina psychrophila]AMQ06767.1 hypothetical protein AZE41_12940 [Sporosarcina psychrophila]